MSTQMTDRPTPDTAPTTSGRRRGWWIAGAIGLVVVLAVGWYLVEPALFDDTVDTAFDVSIDAAAGSADSGDGGTADGEGDLAEAEAAVEQPGDPMDGAPFPDEAEDAPAPAEPSANDEPVAEQAGAPDAAPAPAPTAEQPVSQPSEEAEPAPEPQPEGPVLVASGEFRGLDNHDASGQAAIFTQPDGTQVIRLENLDVDNGPELELHLVPGADQTRPGDGTFIAPLQGNQGNQTYTIPEGFDVPETATVLIWCVPFRTAIGGATLTPA